MPMIELLNHGAAAGYDPTNGVAVRGLFADEVLVSYSEAHDTFLCFAAWGFVCERPFAYSAPLHVPTAQGEMVITINPVEGRMIEAKLQKPMQLKLPKLLQYRIGFGKCMIIYMNINRHLMISI